MHKRNQIIIVVSVLIIMIVLLMQPIKGLINPPNENEAASASNVPSVTFQTESQRAKQGLNPAISEEISRLETQLEQLQDEAERAELLQTLATKWEDVNKASPQGFIYEELAETSQQPEHWLKAGNAYRSAFSLVQDTTVANPLNEYAIHAYEQALALEPENLDAKTGLGASFVNRGTNPMAGIALLQEVVGVDPDNLEANKALGIFSLQSRQFDRAIDRFQTVVSIQPDAESYFYLATGYEQIGLNREAIEAYEKSKQLAADPTLSQFIERKIEELSK